jgi:integrase/recombinase XerD
LLIGLEALMRWHLLVPKVSGPLAAYAEGYELWLEARGYSPGSAKRKVWQLSQLSCWLEREGLAGGEWTGEMAARFAAGRQAAGCPSYLSRLSLRVPLAYLREIGAMPAPSPVAGPVEELLADLRTYLARERGLVAGTIRNYERAARLFLEDRVERVGGLELQRLAAGEVTAFLARECPRRTVSGAMDLAANLRALLRYLHVVGLIDAPLVWAVPKVADLRGRSLPKGLEPEAIAAMLAVCDRERLIGRRDLAVLLLLVRLGLRAGEVAGIELDDVDWRAGELLVHGKGHRHDGMPLPVDVGEALVAYLRVRPSSEHRVLFLCVLAPFGPISNNVVANVVRRACRQAGVPQVGPHRLRHTTATQMLRARASLEEIAQVLRHRHLVSTAHYARVDRDSLRALALPWPGDRS